MGGEIQGEGSRWEEFLRFVEWPRVRKSIARRAESAPGGALCRALEPSVDPDEVRVLQSLTREALELLARDVTLELGGVSDLAWTFERARSQRRALTGRELYAVANTLLLGRAAREAFAGQPGLRSLVDVDPETEASDAELAQAIVGAIDRHGRLNDEASETLRKIRAGISETRAGLRAALARLAYDPAISRALAERRPIEHQGQPCLGVLPQEIRRVPGPILAQEPGGVLRVEPDQARELYNELRHLDVDERAEALRLTQALSARVEPRGEDCARLSFGLTRADAHMALARYARELELEPPALTVGLELRLEAARHPLIAEEGGCVPIQLDLKDGLRLVVISGPNGGGKTVAMKTIGLLAALAQIGSYVPAAAGVRLPIFTSFLAVAEARTSVEDGLSTFQAHASDLAEVARRARPGCLILLDEIGFGTDPGEAAALAQAFLEYTLEQGGIVLATTHLSPLKAFAGRAEGAANAAVHLDESGDPTFELTLGEVGRSFALDVARGRGLPDSICDRAASLHTGSA